MATAAPVFVGGYKLSPSALARAGLNGMSLNDVHNVLSDTTDQRRNYNGSWSVTDGKNTVVLYPEDSFITDVLVGK